MGVSKGKRPASYVIRIVGMENGTWQGSVEHVQSGEKDTFKGCLEMIRLMEKTLIPTMEANESHEVKDDSQMA